MTELQHVQSSSQPAQKDTGPYQTEDQRLIFS